MRRNPIFVFEDENSQGIYDIPLGSVIQIMDSDGAGNPLITQLVDKSKLTPDTTIGDFLNDGGFKDLDKNTLSELEKIEESGSGSGTSIGWRLLGSNPDHFGTIGSNAVDLSNSSDIGNFGAVGENSFAAGHGTTALNKNSVALGAYNVGTSLGTLLEFGNGAANDLRKNILEIYRDGTVVAPSTTNSLIATHGDKALTTRNYVETRVASEFPSQTTDNLDEGIANFYYTEGRVKKVFRNEIVETVINSLKDVNTATTTPSDGNVLKFDGASLQWKPGKDLNDITSVNAQTGDVVLSTDEIAEGSANLYWNEGRFNTSFALKNADELDENTAPTATSNLYFTENRSKAVFDTKILDATLNQLADVSEYTPLDYGKMLVYGTSGFWEPAAPPGGVSSVNSQLGNVVLKLDDIDDVDVSLVNNNNVLRYNAGIWSSSAETIVTVLDVLTSTDATSALSANQGSILNGKFSAYTGDITALQTQSANHETRIVANTAAIVDKEDGLNAPITNGDVLSSLTDGTRSWVTPATEVVVVNDLTTGGTAAALSADQGVVLEAAKANTISPTFTGNTVVQNLAISGTLSGPLATGAIPGLSKQGAAIASITVDGTETVAGNANKINDLLASLRTAGIIAT